MKRYHSRKFRLGYLLKIFKKDGTVVSYRRRLKTRIIDLIVGNLFLKLRLKVTYGQGNYNEGVYLTKKDALVALKAFTEKPLLDELERW